MDWRARLRRWLRPPRRLQFTREGKYFVGITFGVGFAAINTGNNLLYLLFGMLLSLILASGVLSEISLRGLEVARQAPGRVHARQPFLMGISLRNDKRRLPSFSVEVEDLIDDKPLDKKCYFLKLPAKKLQATSYRHTCARRGRYRFSGFRVSTKFPFALFRKSRLVDAALEVIVYPELLPLGRAMPRSSRAQGEELHGLAGRRGEFAGLHEYREGDDPHDVHWPSTARKGRTMVREYEDEAARRVSLFLDNHLPGGARCTDERLCGQLERAVSITATLAVDYLSRGWAVRLCTRGGPAAPPWLRGTGQIPSLLRTLALLEAIGEEAPYAIRPDGASPAARNLSTRVLEA